MKKVLCALLVLLTILGPVAVSNGAPVYRDYWVSTLDFTAEVKDRIADLAAMDNPSAIDVELCLQYCDMYIRLMHLMTVEMKAEAGGTPPEPLTNNLEEQIEHVRTLYKLGIVSEKEIISGFAQGILN